MKVILQHRLWLVFFIVCKFLSANAQIPTERIATAINQTVPIKGLFDTDDILHITLRGNIRTLLNDRAAKPQYHPLTLIYNGEDSNQKSIAVKVKTRGHFRKLKENCYYPPLLIRFSKSDTLSSSVFCNSDKLKLVMPCKGDEYIIHEWLMYKLYNLVTPKSFRARLVSVVLDDLKNKKTPAAFFAILLEEENQMAKRNNAVSITRKLAPSQTDTTAFLKMAVFQYLIGNTDWSVEYQQNIKLMIPDSNTLPITVPYDFDHAGLVNAPYARPAEELEMKSIRERRYRGYCLNDLKFFDEVFTLYNNLKKDIYGLFTGCTLLDASYIKSTEKFLDEFYSTINNTKAVQKEFGYPCNKKGTGNIVIKGLKEE